MIKGIIVRNTPAHLAPEDMAGCAVLFAEAEAFARGCSKGTAGVEWLPMISSFLGAKAWPVKASELACVKSAGARRALFFPDLRNIKYGFLPSFCKEMESVERLAEGIDCIVYLAIDCLTPGELSGALAELEGRRLDIMLGFGGGDEGRVASAVEVVSGLIGRVEASRLWCSFWDPSELGDSMSGLEKLGIQRVVALA